MSDLRNKIDEIDKQIENLKTVRASLMSEIQSACMHPEHQRKAEGYTYDDGYGGSAGRSWINTGWSCKVCGHSVSTRKDDND